MNTYIFYTRNSKGSEWVSEQGETEVIVAASLNEALDNQTIE